ncbi:MAG: DUF1292 domain-containing protein [Eubacterium sp.]
MSNEPNTPMDDDILDPQDMQVTLELDDGTEMDCQILTIFEVEEQDYIALALIDQIGNDECEVFLIAILKMKRKSDLDNLESDEEFEIVSDIFDQIMDDEEFDQM